MLEIQKFFSKVFTNYLHDEWLLVNKKVILMVCLDENQKKLATSIVCKNVVK